MLEIHFKTKSFFFFLVMFKRNERRLKNFLPHATNGNGQIVHFVFVSTHHGEWSESKNQAIDS